MIPMSEHIDDAIEQLEAAEQSLETEMETEDLSLADIGVKMALMSVRSDIKTLKEHKSDLE